MAELTNLKAWVYSFQEDVLMLKRCTPVCKEPIELKHPYEFVFEYFFYRVFERLGSISYGLKLAMRHATALKDIKDASPVPLEEIIDKCKKGQELYKREIKLCPRSGTMEPLSEFIEVANEVLALTLKLFENLTEKHPALKGHIERWEEILELDGYGKDVS